MRNRNLIMNKIDHLEGFMKALRGMVQQGRPIKDFLDTLNKSEETLLEVKDTIAREPLSTEEINRH